MADLKMKINEDILIDNNPPTYEWVQEHYGLPETLGGMTSDAKIASDNALRGPLSLLHHTMKAMSLDLFPQFLGYGFLMGISQDTWIRAGVEMIADEMTKEGVTLQYGGERENLVPEMDEELLKYDIIKHLHDALTNCGYYGGCLLYIDTGEEGAELLNPLVLDQKTFQQGSLKGFKIVEAYNISPGTYNSTEPLKKDFYKPKTWWVLGRQIHESRFCYFTQNEISTLLLPAYNFFGIPLSQIVLDAVSHFKNCKEAQSRLAGKFADIIFKTNLQEILEGGSGAELAKRIRFFVQNRSNDGCQVIDRETEDISVVTTPLGGITDIVRQSMELVAASFNEPVVKMWGISPSGFNTGATDLQNHYDHIESLQDKMLKKQLEKILKVLQLNKYGVIDEKLTFEFNSPSKEDEFRKIGLRKEKAIVDDLYLKTGAISPYEIRQRLIKDKDSGYVLEETNELTEEQIQALKEAYAEAEATVNTPNIQ